MTIAILSSGHGGQHPGMFRLTGAAPEAEPAFAAATKALDGRDPRGLVVDAPDALHEDRVAQLLCCTAALAAWRALGPAVEDANVLAGYSIGELAAWGCAGVLDVETVMHLARVRAEAMDEVAGAGTGLLALRGLARRAVDALCAEHACDVAIIDGPRSFVVGGVSTDLERLGADALARGATRTVHLPVAVASHTPRLAMASERFRTALEALPVRARVRPGLRLLRGIDGRVVFDVVEGEAALAAQIARPVDWARCLEACREALVTTVLELGPGHALAAMASEVMPRARCRSLDDFSTLAGARRWLADDRRG